MRFLALGLSILTFSLALSSVARGAVPSCQAVFDPNSTAAQPAKTQVTVSEKRVESITASLFKKFAIVDRPVQRLLFKRTRTLLDSLTNMLVFFHSHTYPFSYLKDGVVLKIRLWIRDGGGSMSQEIDSWFKRYQSYPMDRRLAIERTAFVRVEAEILESLLKRADSDFPILVDVPQYKRHGIAKEAMIFTTKKAVKVELAQLQKSERYRFNSIPTFNLERSMFLRSRDQEQARLEVRLRVLLEELKKFPLSAEGRERRQQLMSNIETVLADRTLDSTPFSRYVESRRAFSDELSFFTGSRDYSGGDVENLSLEDYSDFGIDPERPGLFSRIGRNVVVQTPRIVAGLLILAAYPVVKYDVKASLFTESYMHEIADLPEGQYQQKSLEFLKYKSDTLTKNGGLRMTDDVKKMIAHLQELRADHMRDLADEKISVAEFSLVLDGGAHGTVVSRQEFQTLMTMPKDDFVKTARAYSKRLKTAAETEALLARLAKARDYCDDESVEISKGQSRVRRPKPDAVIEAFSEFMLGASADVLTLN